MKKQIFLAAGVALLGTGIALAVKHFKCIGGNCEGNKNMPTHRDHSPGSKMHTKPVTKTEEKTKVPSKTAVKKTNKAG